MPDGLPRDLSAQDVVAAFEKAGGLRRRAKGSHCSVKMPNGQIITIPMHGSVKVGLLGAAIKKAGLTLPQFLAFVER